MALCLDGRTWRRIFSPCQCQERRTNLHDGPSDNQCIRNITIRPNFNTHHLQQFVDLWIIVREASLNPEIADTIRWKWTASGEYFAASTYRAQFFGSVATKLQLIWKPWARPKCNFFAWLTIKNRVWMSRDWLRIDVCPLCRIESESAQHLLVTFHVTRRVWTQIAEWVHYHQLIPSHWDITHSVKY